MLALLSCQSKVCSAACPRLARPLLCFTVQTCLVQPHRHRRQQLHSVLSFNPTTSAAYAVRCVQATLSSECYQATAAVPVHARYPRPLNLVLPDLEVPDVSTEAAGPASISAQAADPWIAGLQQWRRHVAGGPVVEVELPQPQLLLRCSPFSREACSGDANGCLSSDWQHATAATTGDGDRRELLVWGMPAGCLRHGWWVGYATMLAILAGAAAVLASMV